MVELEEQATSEANRHIIERPRLTRQLDETTARVIMLVAPAGYGKTTLARQWLAGRKHVWFEANTASADVAGLVRGLSEALESSGSSSHGQTLELLRSIHDAGDALETLARLQAECLDPWPADAWLAIDDYEAVAASDASDRYVELLLRISKMNLLLTSRLMPFWATPRKRLYGDYFVVGRSELAMTDSEAQEMLRRSRRDEVPPLIAAAAGWPAVLGLASLTEGQELDGVLPQTLYDYFADELFQKASPSLRRALPELALLPTITPEIVDAGFGTDDASSLLAETKELGFVTDGARGLTFQPLLRAFLRRKRKADAPVSNETVDRLIAFLVDSQKWDDAFDVIREAPRPEALVDLMELAHEPLLRAGRTATLIEWLASAESMAVEAPLLDLMRAELAVRRGSAGYAEQLALRVADHASERSIAARALSIAGRAAHLDNRGQESLSHFRAAGELAETDKDRHHAAWGALLAAQELESDDELRLVLDAFLRYGTDSGDDAIRAANARLAIALTKSGLSGVLEPALATARTFRSNTDPVALTSLLNSLSRSLSLAARYEEAQQIAEEELDLATSANLHFVMPFGHVAKAAALVGLARYREAEDNLSLATRYAEELEDDHNLFDALTAQAKAAIAQRQPERAAELTAGRADTSELSSGMRAEYAATRGLALACLGREEADAVLNEAESASSIPEVSALISCGRAVVALKRGSPPADASRELDRAFELLMLDPLVIACRAYPDTIDAAKATGRHLPQRLLEAMTIRQSPTDRDPQLASLTPREKEVLELLARGYTNREIAEALVIAEVTAKVHVRRIIQKLGVRSRTEAAIAAVQRRAVMPN